MFQTTKTIWDAAVTRNQQALSLVAAELLAVLAVYGGVNAVKVSRAVHAAIIRVLRPAESALRRLIVIAARDVTVSPKPYRVAPAQSTAPRSSSRKPQSRMAFALFDPRKRFGARRIVYTALTPRVSFVEPLAPFSPLSPQPVSPLERPPISKKSDPDISVRRLYLRIASLASAVNDIPRQALRLARLRIKRESQQRPRFLSPLRPGRPPGHRTKHQHAIDEILAECHKYALGVLSEAKPDTS